MRLGAIVISARGGGVLNTSPPMGDRFNWFGLESNLIL